MTRSLVHADSWGWTFADADDATIRDVSFTITAGERVLITGPSGGGKSTLVRAIAGIDAAELGTSTGSFVRAPQTVGFVGQEPDEQILFPTVAEDIGFVAETAVGTAAEVAPRVQHAMMTVGLTMDGNRGTAALSGGEKQRVAIAAALAGSPDVLVMDEPTAGLDVPNARRVRDAVLHAIASREVALVMVEHRLDEWRDVMDRIVVVVDGRIVADGPITEVLSSRADELRAWGVQVPASAPEPAEPAGSESAGGAANSREEPRDIVLRSTHVTASRGALGRHIAVPDIEVRAGDCVAVMGATGSGKTAALRVWGGLAAPRAGSVQVASLHRPPHRTRPRHLAAAVSSMLQNPAYGFIHRRVADEAPAELLAALGLSHVADHHPHSLSGGERRRLGVAIALAGTPRVVLLDEPTFGQDPHSVFALVTVLRDYVCRGGAVVIATHDEHLVASLGARVVQMGPVS
ncbi:energy-coupling factor transport system ATP-binding protein [Microbacteriaceae bacterium MWH-Ta3]|nr:energy-coupling factor transport system ATP-binding protein [Microbacteriaceae bacterium MWH-Ta3]